MAEEVNNKDIGKAVLEIFGKETIAKLMSQIKSMDKVASGKLIGSLDYRLKNFITGFQLEFEGVPHAINVLQGRKAGRFVPVKALQDWMKIRGIDLKYTFPINRKIFKFGIKPANFINDVINNNSINSLVNKLEDNYQKELENQIEKFFFEKT